MSGRMIQLSPHGATAPATAGAPREARAGGAEELSRIPVEHAASAVGVSAGPYGGV